MQKIDEVPVWGDPLPEAVNQMKAVMNYEATRPEYVALMADHHIGYSVPVGGLDCSLLTPIGVCMDDDRELDPYKD